MEVYVLKNVSCFCLVICTLLLIACKSEPEIIPSLQVSNPILETPLSEKNLELSEDLYGWLKLAPFTQLWDPYKGRKKGDIVITNISYVYPFLGEWHDAFGQIDNEEHFREYESVIFMDENWGKLLYGQESKKTLIDFI